MRTLAPLIAALFAMSATAQDRVIRLYDGPAPGSEHWKQSERENNNNQWQTRVAYNYQSENRPDFVAPIYLAYDWVPRKSVPADAPPIFILAATDDPLGLGPQSAALYRDWTAAGKSAELVLYAKGGHGFGMRKQNLPSDRWIERFADWLDAQGWLSPATTR